MGRGRKRLSSDCRAESLMNALMVDGRSGTYLGSHMEMYSQSNTSPFLD